MSQKYPKAWREVSNRDGTVISHDRLCGQYRVIPGIEHFDCYRIAEDGFMLEHIGQKDSLAEAMAFCRLHLDGHAT